VCYVAFSATAPCTQNHYPAVHMCFISTIPACCPCPQQVFLIFHSCQAPHTLQSQLLFA
jgi:hypothetical protein